MLGLYEETKRLHVIIDDLKSKLKDANEDRNHYRDELIRTREKVLKVFNASGAKTEIVDGESLDDAWIRYIQAAIDKLNSENSI